MIARLKTFWAARQQSQAQRAAERAAEQVRRDRVSARAGVIAAALLERLGEPWEPNTNYGFTAPRGDWFYNLLEGIDEAFKGDLRLHLLSQAEKHELAQTILHSIFNGRSGWGDWTNPRITGFGASLTRGQWLALGRRIVGQVETRLEALPIAEPTPPQAGVEVG